MEEAESMEDDDAMEEAESMEDDDAMEDDTAMEDAEPMEDEPMEDAEPLTLGYVVAGDSQDGGFYQGQIDAARSAAEVHGWEIIVVDQVNPGAAQEAFQNLARQGPDIIVGGGAELTDGFIPVACSGEFDQIRWFLVAPFPPPQPCFSTGDSNEAQAHYIGGIAVGLLLDRSEGDTIACDIAGPELDFVKNAAAHLEAGLKDHNPDYELRVTFTGDFENAALAQEAAQAQIDQGCSVIYPYLGGALSAVVRAGNSAGINVVATSVNRCDDPSAEFAMGITFNPATWIDQVFESMASGELAHGDSLGLFGVADDAGVGAVICDASPSEQQVLDDTAARIAAGEIDFEAIAGGG
jgi:basic membrane protein A